MVNNFPTSHDCDCKGVNQIAYLLAAFLATATDHISLYTWYHLIFE